jgi:hypothetical protein
MANLTLRTPTENPGNTIKLTPLTYAEMDANFINLDTEISALSTAVAAPGGSLLVGYLPGGNNAVATTVGAKFRESISVVDFGADPTGILDSTNAIKAAIAHGYVVLKSGNSGAYGPGLYYVGSTPEIFFPAGVYKVTDDLTLAINWLNFRGERSILSLAPGVTAFEGVMNSVDFSGLIFRGGACAISIKTTNQDAVRISVDNCEFHEQTESMIRADANSESTILNITNSRFIQSVEAARSAYIFEFLSMDMVNVDNCWITAHGFNKAAFYCNVVNFSMTNCLLVPGGDYDNVAIVPESFAYTGRWFDWYGATLRCRNVRFGGESGGAPIVYNYTNIKDHGEFPWISYSIVLDSCEIPCNLQSNRADAGVIVAKRGLPALIRIVGCRGMVDAPYIRDEMNSGTLLSYLTDYETSVTEYPPFTIEIANNNNRGNLLTDIPEASTILSKYGRLSINTRNKVVDYFGELKTNKLEATDITSETLIGKNYVQTSTSGTNSIVDTDITSTTPIVGYNKSAVYDIVVSGNPNSSGSNDYRYTQIGVIIIGTGFTGTTKTNISYLKIGNSEATVIPGELTVTALFWDGVSETTEATINSTTHQIRIKIAGYTGAVGSGQGVRLVKKY